MQMNRGRCFADRLPVRLICRALLLLAGAVHLQLATAQQSEPMSPSVVLVLKLVSSTLVKPTTGVVVSDNGLVLVPAGFATEAGEMIVLDGGTDIASNGRPAKLVEDAAGGDLALLSVKGLQRPGIGFAGNLAETAGDLHLSAFPPAEEIAKGAKPLDLPVKTVAGATTGQYALSAETPLPYVTGAILDSCGRLAGLSLASGPQSLETGQPTSILLGADLRRVLDSMQVTLPSADCAPLAKVAAPQVAVPEKPREPAPAEKPDETATQTGAVEVVPEEVPAPVAGASEQAPPDNAAGEAAGTQSVARVTEPPGIWREVPAWLWIIAVIVLVAGAWKAVYFFKLHRPAPAPSGWRQSAGGVQPASDEPDTAPLADTDDGSPLKPRSAPVTDFAIPETAVRPEGCDGLLLVEGLLDADTPFKRFCFVDTGRIDIVIGRGNADIAIEHPAISRNHAAIRTDGGRLTISDLDSSNGSFIGDVPCLPGEVMYLESGAEIFLGDVQMTIEVVKQEAEWA